MTSPLGEWPDFSSLGELYTTGGSRFIFDDQYNGEPHVVIEDGLFKLMGLSFREDTSTTGLLYSSSTHDSDPSTGWDSRLVGGFADLDFVGEGAGTITASHTDTPCYFRNPTTGKYLLYYTEDPGFVRVLPNIGEQLSIGVAHSDTPLEAGKSDWTRVDQLIVNTLAWEKPFVSALSGANLIWAGGCSEPSAVWLPHLGRVRLFYRGQTQYAWQDAGEPSNPVAGNYTWSIGYADLSDDGLSLVSKRATPFWDPANPTPGFEDTFVNFYGAWQASFTGDPRAGGVHMVLTNSKGIHHFWSPDWGDTWYVNPNNPIIRRGETNMPDNSGQVGAPTLVIDETYNRYLIFFDGVDSGIRYQAGKNTLLWVGTASRPDNPILDSSTSGKSISSSRSGSVPSVSGSGGTASTSGSGGLASTSTSGSTS